MQWSICPGMNAYKCMLFSWRKRVIYKEEDRRGKSTSFHHFPLFGKLCIKNAPLDTSSEGEIPSSCMTVGCVDMTTVGGGIRAPLSRYTAGQSLSWYSFQSMNVMINCQCYYIYFYKFDKFLVLLVGQKNKQDGAQNSTWNHISRHQNENPTCHLMYSTQWVQTLDDNHNYNHFKSFMSPSKTVHLKVKYFLISPSLTNFRCSIWGDVTIEVFTKKLYLRIIYISCAKLELMYSGNNQIYLNQTIFFTEQWIFRCSFLQFSHFCKSQAHKTWVSMDINSPSK